MTQTALIAVVDDDVAVRQATSRLLRSLGYRTETFDSAEHFLTANDAAWSCVITDVKMPGRSGLELQAELRSRGNHVPVIVMTAFPDLGVEARALAAGAFAFLAKPCHEDALASCIRAALRQSAAE